MERRGAERGQRPVLRRDAPPRDTGGDRHLLSGRRKDRGQGFARVDRGASRVPPARRGPRRSAGRGGDDPPHPTRPVPEEVDRKEFRGSDDDGCRFSDHGVRVAAERVASTERGGGEGPIGDDLARRTPDRHGPDVRSLAGCQPERVDGRRGAGAGAVAGMGGRLQLTARSARDPRRHRFGVDQSGCVVLEPRPRRSDGRRRGPGRGGRLRRDHLAGQDCAIGSDVVFFCIPRRPGGRRPGGRRDPALVPRRQSRCPEHERC